MSTTEQGARPHYVHKGCGGTVLWDMSGGWCLTCHTENLDMDDVEPEPTS